MVSQKFNRSYHSVFNACKQIVESKDYYVSDIQYNKGFIRARTGVTLLSFGSDIDIKITNDSRPRVEIQKITPKGILPWFGKRLAEWRLLKAISNEITQIK